MSVFVNTSAFFGILDAEDTNHKQAAREWRRLIDSDEHLITSNYVILETSALLQNRIGMNALKVFHEEVAPVLRVVWVSEMIQRESLAMLWMAGRKKLSFVDCVSFQIMRAGGISRAFTFDRHFKELGFEMIP